MVLRQLLGFTTTCLGLMLFASAAYALTPGSWKLAASNRLLPGYETNAKNQLDPAFRADVEEVVTRLRAEGFHPRVAATFRNPQRQNFIFHLGAIVESYGGPIATRATGGRSCHNRVDAKGRPASLAADILSGPSRTTGAERAVFYKALGRAARAQGLTWGGDWSKRNPYWARHGLGWDPGHLQARRCGK